MTRSGTWLASAAVIALTVGVTSRADLPTKHELPLPQGSIIIAVPAAAPVTALVEADKSHIVPGAVLALSLMSGPDGRPATPGFTIQSLPAPGGDAAPKAAKSASKPGAAKAPR